MIRNLLFLVFGSDSYRAPNMNELRARQDVQLWARQERARREQERFRRHLVEGLRQGRTWTWKDGAEPESGMFT